MYFEKVSLNEWSKSLEHLHLDEEIIERWYNEIKLPKQATIGSMGMDFFAPYTIRIPPKHNILIPTGVRWVVDKDNYDKGLIIVPRSGLGFKYGIKLVNTIGVIDASYSAESNTSNEGHIMIKLYNPSDEIVNIEKGSGIAQGIILPYYICEGAESTEERIGGFGSTTKIGE